MSALLITNAFALSVRQSVLPAGLPSAVRPRAWCVARLIDRNSAMLGFHRA